MKVYPILCTEWDRYGHRDLTIVVEVFDSYDAAFEYAVMLAETAIRYPTRHIDIDQDAAVTYEANKLMGYVRTYDANGNICDEFSLWAETVRSKGWHA